MLVALTWPPGMHVQDPIHKKSPYTAASLYWSALINKVWGMVRECILASHNFPEEKAWFGGRITLLARGVCSHRCALLSWGRIVHFWVFTKREQLPIISNSWLSGIAWILSEFSIMQSKISMELHIKENFRARKEVKGTQAGLICLV